MEDSDYIGRRGRLSVDVIQKQLPMVNAIKQAVQHVEEITAIYGEAEAMRLIDLEYAALKTHQSKYVRGMS